MENVAVPFVCRGFWQESYGDLSGSISEEFMIVSVMSGTALSPRSWTRRDLWPRRPRRNRNPKAGYAQWSCADTVWSAGGLSF